MLYTKENIIKKSFRYRGRSYPPFSRMKLVLFSALTLLCQDAGLALPPLSDATLAALLGRWGGLAQEEALQVTASGLGDERRLVHVAARCFPSLQSTSQAKAALKRGALLLNGEVREGCRHVADGDVLSLTPPPTTPLAGDALGARVRFTRHLLESGMRVLYEDDELAVVHKPAGVHTKKNTNPKYGALAAG